MNKIIETRSNPKRDRIVLFFEEVKRIGTYKENTQAICMDDFSHNYLLEGRDNDNKYPVVLNHTYMKETGCEELIKCLNKEELDYLRLIKSEKRKKSYLYGRYSLKKAISLYSLESQLNKIIIKNGIFGQPIIKLDSFTNINGSISHCETCAVSLVYEESLILGIDIEDINRNIKKVLKKNITSHEALLIKNQEISEEIIFVILWTAKEALAKCLKTGLTVPMEIYEVEKIENHENCLKISYTNFLQYTALTYIFDDYVCSVAYPKLIDISFDITQIIK